ncbi:MAG: amidohydrolase [Clostridiales Family XIII bacterium]|jgi:5-methylthioadenosine/S-adenosylhomocysteine deaminase|nr:amidohydrolase [Clostridiales Family XIII bacterium]
MLFEEITALTPDGGVMESAFVGVRDGTIAYVGDRRPEGEWGRVYDGGKRLLMPGFYNAHAHSPMTLMRGYGENLALRDWLFTRIFPFEANIYAEAVYHATLLAMAESFRYGIVSTSDAYFFTEDMVRAVLESGAKANIARSLAGVDEDEDMYRMDSFAEAKRAFDEYDGAEDGRVRIDMSLHMEETSTERLARQLAEYSAKIGARMQVHMSETISEHEGCKERRGGRTPVAYFADIGLFDSPTTAAHCVWVEAEDMEIMRDKGVTVASCPISNLKLASGVADVPALIDVGVDVAIGTDSVASNNSLNIIEEMKFFALLNKERRDDPTLITPRQSVYAATRAGALSQGRVDCGFIKEGFRADLVVLDLSSPGMHPIFDIYSNVVYSASGSDVTLTMVDGKVVYEDGEYTTIDVERAIAETGKACADIARRTS